jgi:TetR/AcrR family transcriptional repressor of nem operon
MGRLKQFEKEEALHKSMTLFWSKGYEHTSLKDLLAEMDILNGSFYNTFGNKKNLFIETLEFYGREITAKRADVFEQHDTFKKGIRAFFKKIFASYKDPNCPKGCLLSNSISPELINDPELFKFIQDEITGFEKFFEIQIQKAMDRGEIISSINSKTYSSLIVTYIQGLMRLNNLQVPVAKMNKQTEVYLNSLGL